MSAYQNVDNLLNEFVNAYFDERNVDGVLNCVCENICWIGTSDYERAVGKQQLKVILLEDMGEQEHSYTTEILENIPVCIGDNIVNFNIVGKQKTENFSMTMRATICCANDGSGWLINTVHASVSNQLQHEGEFYPHHNDDFNYEQLRREIFDQMFSERDIDYGVKKSIEIIGSAFNVSRVYIFENSKDNLSASNTYEWCAKGIESQIENLQNLRYSEDIGGEYLNNFDNDGLFYCPDISKLPDKQKEVLEPQGIVSMLQVAIIENGVFRGFIGYDVCDETDKKNYIDKKETKILSYISKLLSVSLLRERHYQNIVSYQKKLEDSLKEEENLRLLASHANKAKSDFFSRMSHDMRTPLNCILGIVRLELDENPPERYAQPFRDILTSGEFLLSLINDVLDMSKIERGGIDLHKEPYGYLEFINDMTNMIEPICREKNITLNMNPMSDTCTINVDKIRFRQIFFNVFSNAVKYTPAGGTVDHYTEVTPIDDSHMDCKCHIIDNGIGMSEEFQKHLFEPFQQEKQDGYAAVQGTGLGLSIANSLANSMGGELIIKSELNKGTEVIIHTVLEIVDDSKTRVVKSQRPKLHSDLKGRKILLCEDHHLNAKIAVRLLEKAGCEVVWAENGRLGVDKFIQYGNEYFDAVIMDIRMPVMNGIEASRMIKSIDSEYAKNIPIIAMTANAFEEDRKRTADAGMAVHIPKPIDPQLLYETLEKLISESRLKITV